MQVYLFNFVQCICRLCKHHRPLSSLAIYTFHFIIPNCLCENKGTITECSPLMTSTIRPHHCHVFLFFHLGLKAAVCGVDKVWTTTINLAWSATKQEER